MDRPMRPDDEDPRLAMPRQRLVDRLLRHAPCGPPVTPAALPGTWLARADAESHLMCSIYEPCVALVLQGRKRVDIGDRQFHYDRSRYFVTPLDLPAVATILDATPERPFLSMAVRLDLREISALVLEGVASPTAAGPEGSVSGGADRRASVSGAADRRAMTTGAISAGLLECFDRLLALIDEPEHAPVLAPMIRREIAYRLLSGEAGWRLRQIAGIDGQGAAVARAIERLRAHFAAPLRVEDLARDAHMSVSSFHHHFKALTGLSPLQFQKQLRLTEARRLLLTEGVDAATAAYRVGYESPSQFSREYSRHFGAPPMRDIAGLRQPGATAAAGTTASAVAA